MVVLHSNTPPAFEYKEGKGRIVFCQSEVTGRTANEPAAERLTRNLLGYLERVPTPEYSQFMTIAGDSFKRELKQLRLINEVNSQEKATVIIVGPGLTDYPDLTTQVESGKTLLLLGIDAKTATKLLPGWSVQFKDEKNVPSQIAALDHPAFNGINNLDSYFQTKLNYATLDNKELTAIKLGKGEVVFAGVIPSMLDYNELFRLRSSFRRRAFLISQLLRNAAIASESELLTRFHSQALDKPWLNSYYLQEPISGDDPYRYYHW